ncbi:MAG: hypothetical protein AAB462_00780 [Patescibacteria group bacterium]
MSNGQRVLVVFGLVLVVVLGFNITTYIKHRGMVKITVAVLPSDSTLLLDDKKVKPGGIYVTAGSHKLTASRQYFTTVSKTINTTDSNSSDIIYLMPSPDSEEAKKWLEEHPKEQLAREAQGGVEAVKTQTLLDDKYPVIKKLPEYNSRYKIDYALDSNNNISFSITLYAIINRPEQYPQYQQQLKQYKAEALKFLTDNKINVQKTPITYTPDVD